MTSPFPGMDPFIEGQKWPDFHLELISGIRASLIQQLRPRYVVEVELHVYVEYQPNGGLDRIEPEAMLLQAERPEIHSGGAVATAVVIEPVLLTLPLSDEGVSPS